MATPTEMEINIKELVLDEPLNPGWIFDPDRDLLEEERAIMERCFKLISGNVIYNSTAADLKILAPGMLTQFYADPDSFENVKRACEHYPSPGEAGHSALLKDARILFPQRYSQIQIDGGVATLLEGNVLTFWRQAMEMISPWDSYLNQAAAFLVAFPHKRGSLPLDEETWRIVSQQQLLSIGTLPQKLANIRILFPDRPLPHPITTELLDQLRVKRDQQLGASENLDLRAWEDFIQDCADLVVAQTVNPKLDQQAEKPPIVRQF